MVYINLGKSKSNPGKTQSFRIDIFEFRGNLLYDERI